MGKWFMLRMRAGSASEQANSPRGTRRPKADVRMRIGSPLHPFQLDSFSQFRLRSAVILMGPDRHVTRSLFAVSNVSVAKSSAAPCTPAGAMFFANESSYVVGRSLDGGGGGGVVGCTALPPSLASLRSLARRVASNFLQHCKKWMRDGFASSSFSGFFYKSQGFQDGAPNTPPAMTGRGAEALFILFGGAARTQPSSIQPTPDRVLRGTTRIKMARLPRSGREEGREGGRGGCKKVAREKSSRKGKGSRSRRRRRRESNFLGGLV